MIESPHAVALELTRAVLKAEGKTLGTDKGYKDAPTKDEILDAFRDCLQAVQGLRS